MFSWKSTRLKLIISSNVLIFSSILIVSINFCFSSTEKGTIILKGADILIGFLDEAINKKDVNINQQTVEIFILPDCPWSSRAVRMLRTLHIPHDIIVIETNDDFNSLHTRSNYSRFPQISIDEDFIGGYSELAELHASGKFSSK